MSSPSPRVALGAIVLAQLLVMTLWFSASAVAPELGAAWGLSPGRQAWLTASVQLGFVVGALISALTNLPDRIPAQRLFAASALVAAALTAAIPLAETGYGPTLFLRGLTGVALAGVYPPGMKLAASWTTRGRGLAIGAVVGALTLGSATPHLLGALLGEGTLPDWRPVLLAASALAVGGALLAALFLQPGPHLARSAPFDARFALRSFTEKPLRLANLGYLGHMWELYAMWTWVPVLLRESYLRAGHDADHARLAAFATIAAGSLGCLAAGALADRHGRTLVAGVSLAVSGACCLLAGPLSSSPALLTALCLVWGFAVVADSAQFSAAISELADSRYVGTALAIQTSAGFLLTLVSIRLVPVVTEAAGWTASMGLLALGPVVGVAAMARLRHCEEASAMAGGRR